MDSPSYSTFGYYTQADFRALSDKMGLIPARRDRILSELLSNTELVLKMVQSSFLSDEAKQKFIYNYQAKRVRMRI